MTRTYIDQEVLVGEHTLKVRLGRTMTCTQGSDEHKVCRNKPARPHAAVDTFCTSLMAQPTSWDPGASSNFTIQVKGHSPLGAM